MIGTDKYCDCLEALLPPKRNQKSVKMLYTDTIERFADAGTRRPGNPQEVLEQELSQPKLVAKLTRFGLAAYEIEMVLAKIYERKTMAEIVADNNWSSLGSANHHWRQILKKLRERGYK